MYERDRLFKEINESLTNFDAELRVLRHEKFALDVEIKGADLRWACDVTESYRKIIHYMYMYLFHHCYFLN